MKHTQWIAVVSIIALLGFGCRAKEGLIEDPATEHAFVDTTRGELAVACKFPGCGRWVSPDQSAGRNSYNVNMSISGNQISRRINCTYHNGDQKSAVVIARARASATSIEILNSGRAYDNGPNGQPPCEARVQPQRFRYETKNTDTLVLTGEDGSSTTWTREPSGY